MHEAPQRSATDAVFAGGGEMGALMRARLVGHIARAGR